MSALLFLLLPVAVGLAWFKIRTMANDRRFFAERTPSRGELVPLELRGAALASLEHSEVTGVTVARLRNGTWEAFTFGGELFARGSLNGEHL